MFDGNVLTVLIRVGLRVRSIHFFEGFLSIVAAVLIEESAGLEAVGSSSLSSVPMRVYIILSKVVLVVVLFVHGFDGLASPSLLFSLHSGACLCGHCALAVCILLKALIAVSSLDKSAVRFGC